MSIDLWLEADERLPEAVLVSLLREQGGVETRSHSGVVSFVFPSGMSAFPRVCEGERRIKAEDTRGIHFSVGSRCTLRPSGGDYDMSMKELRCFLERVVAQTGALIVVSFQLEEALFFNAGKGVQACL
jgi:hypothetical protein